MTVDPTGPRLRTGGGNHLDRRHLHIVLRLFPLFFPLLFFLFPGAVCRASDLDLVADVWAEVDC